MRAPLALVLGLGASGCVAFEDLEHCAIPPLPEVEAPTWHRDVRRVVEARCAGCHRDGDIGPFPLTTYAEVFAARAAVREAVVARRMPPWQAAPCCNDFRDDFSLTGEQIAAIDAWVTAGAPEGDSADAPAPLPVQGGLPRTDVEVRMPEPYTPTPEPGRLDDFRCFALEWPLDAPAFVTGLQPVAGARAVLHHVIVAYATGDEADEWRAAESDDGRPGVPCEGGLGDVPIDGILGGSLLGGPFPPGVGSLVPEDAVIVLSVHYSVSDAAPEADQTAIRFMIEPADADVVETETLIVANPAWLVSDAFRIEAGEANKQFRFQYDPRGFTSNNTVQLHGVTPHMHEFGTSLIASIVREDGGIECLLDIQGWDFGWEQPYWFTAPIELRPGDELYIECTFDNSADNQPIIDGRRIEPRAIAWGTDQQDMCAAFLTFTRAEG